MRRPRRRLFRYDFSVPSQKAVRAILGAIKEFGPTHHSWTSPDGLRVHHEFVIDMEDPERARKFAAMNALNGIPWTKLVPPWTVTDGLEP